MTRPALLLLDLINDIVDEKGKLASKGYPAFVAKHNVLLKAAKAIDSARRASVPLIFVRVGFSPTYAEHPAASPLFGAAKKFEALRLGSWGTEFPAILDVRSDDIIVTKHRVSPFYATDLQLTLRVLQVDTVLLAGVATDLVVQSAARDAHDRDYNVVVLEDLCGAASDQDHELALSTLRKIAFVRTSGEESCLSG